MKQAFAIFILCIFSLQVSSQYYLRGIVHDERGKGLYNVKIFLSSKHSGPYTTGTSGAFGITGTLFIDTITLQADGYETMRAVVYANKFNVLTMKLLPSSVSITKNKLISLTKDKTSGERIIYYHGGESYSNLVENVFVETEKSPETGFALNIDRASYSNIRRFLDIDLKVPPDAVRIEEMLNYFSFPNLNTDTPSHLFTLQTQLTSSPLNFNPHLLFINLQAPSINLDSVPPANLVFLIDVSGSMDQPNRLPLLKSAFKLLVKNLRQQDSVAIVIYGGAVGIILQPTSGAEKDIINTAIEQLSAGGDTPGEAAIVTAYSLAKRTFNPNANNRVILATDGDFNVGQTTDKELEDLIAFYKQSGIYLTCLGVGMGNYKDSKLEALAKKGNGNFAYIDNIHEAEKIMVTEFTKTLYAVANDAYATISFNPEWIKQYRLIGFDNKQEALNDTSSELEGGEVGTGHSLMVVFEIVPTDECLQELTRNQIINDFAELKLQYKLPLNDEDVSQDFAIPANFTSITEAENYLRLATAVIMFGELLKQSQLVKPYTWDDIIKLAKPALNVNDISQVEFLKLVEKAKKVYGLPKKKKRDNKS